MTVLWISLGLVLIVAVAMLATARGRRLERRASAEGGRRWNDPAVKVHEEGPPEGADAELRVTLDELIAQRDLLLEEFQEVQARIQVLKREVERRHRLASMEEEADVIVLHDTETPERPESRGP